MRGIKRVVKHTVRAELDDGRIVDVVIPFKGEAATRQAEIDAAVREGLRRADFHWMMYSGCCAQACLNGSEMYRGFVKHHILTVWREQHR